MDRLSLIISELTGSAGRLGGTAAQILADRLELLVLELREVKIRFFQALLLTIMGVAFLMLGLLLLVLAGVYLLPPEWRVYGLAAAAAGSLLAGVIAFMALSRHFNREHSAFEQSLAELKKDATCFSTGK